MNSTATKHRAISEDALARYKATWIWDSLYPSVQKFVQAINTGEPKAVARFVEVHGLLIAKKILGELVMKQFHEYKKFIPPIRRKEMEKLWEILNQMTR